MLIKKINDVIKEKEKYGECINEGVQEKEIGIFKKAAYKELNIELPAEYLQFLKTTNGLESNGSIIYGIDKEFLEHDLNVENNGFIDNNKVWHENEWLKHYVFFGDGDISWYVYDMLSNKYLELDRPSGEEMEEFNNFNDMIMAILNNMI